MSAIGHIDNAFAATVYAP